LYASTGSAVVAIAVRNTAAKNIARIIDNVDFRAGLPNPVWLWVLPVSDPTPVMLCGNF